MKDFKHFGLKRRFYPDHNYNALWCNLKTVRLGEGKALELPANESEFYDVGINTKCNAECPFCYVSASGKGINYPNICETWKKWMDTFWEKQEDRILFTNKPFQIAIGSTGEPTIHPEFCDFLKTVYESGVVPNYTTNGITLSKADAELMRDIISSLDYAYHRLHKDYTNELVLVFKNRDVNALKQLTDLFTPYAMQQAKFQF